MVHQFLSQDGFKGTKLNAASKGSDLVVGASMGVELLGPVCLEGAVSALQGDLQMLRVNMVSHGGVELCPVALLASVATVPSVPQRVGVCVIVLLENRLGLLVSFGAHFWRQLSVDGEFVISTQDVASAQLVATVAAVVFVV